MVLTDIFSGGVTTTDLHKCPSKADLGQLKSETKETYCKMFRTFSGIRNEH